MPQHTINVEVPKVEVLNTDIHVKVKANNRRLGQLTISRGGIGWFSRKSPVERHVTWEQFDRWMRFE